MSEHPRDLLSAYLDGELTATDRADVDAHLAACSECREHLLSLRALTAALHGESVPGVPEDLETLIGRRIDAATVVPFRRRFAIPATIAATIAAVGLVSLFVVEQRLSVAPRVAREREAVRPEVLQNEETAPPVSESKDKKKAERDAVRPMAKQKTAPEPLPPPPVPRELPADQPTQVPSDALSGGAVGGAVGGAPARNSRADESAAKRMTSLGYVNAPAPQAKAEAELATTARRAASDPCAAGVADSPVEAYWLVRDTDEAARQIVLATVASEGQMLPSAPDAPLTLVTVVPAKSYPAFVVRLRAMDVLGLDDVRRVETAGCVRQRIVLRRVAVN
ncbi:MAG TPA: anti-sigma factor [Candidatus Polarisedimenticolaceae bacterium]|nr:anti-sigma factor [Candidatus Polarisedimenticolaceae bacterium]